MDQRKMETHRDSIWIIGADAKTIYANERMAEILGTSPSEMVGRESFAYVFPEDVDEAQRLFDAKTRGDAKPFHFKLRREDGSAVWVACPRDSAVQRGRRIQGNRRHVQRFKIKPTS